MSIPARWKIIVPIIIVLAIVGIGFAVFPSIVNAKMKSKLDAKLHQIFADRVSYDSVTTDYHSNSATIHGFKLQQPDSASAHNPLVSIDEVNVVLDSIYEKHPHPKSLRLHKCVVNAVVDSRGEASIARFIREKPITGRTWEVPVEDLVIEDLTLSSFIAPNAPERKSSQSLDGQPQPPQPANDPNSTPPPAPVADNAGNGIPDQPTSVLSVAHVHATGFILPPERSLLGHEQWIDAQIEKVRLLATADANAEPAVSIDSATFQLDQAETTENPVRLRHVELRQPQLITNRESAGSKAALRRALFSVQQGFGLKEPEAIHKSGKNPPAPNPAGLLIEDFHSADARIESRGASAEGAAGFFRLQNSDITGGNLAFGERVTSSNGFLKVKGPTESSSGPGDAGINITDIQGTYPRVTFHCDYQASNVSAAAFTSSDSDRTRVKRGSVALSFSGGANDGNLGITGSVTLSEDFEIAGDPIKKAGAKLERGHPISPVEITGTIEHPQVQMPSSLALLSDIMGNIVLSGPVEILDSTIGQVPVVGQIVTTPVKEATKGIKKVGNFFLGK